MYRLDKETYKTYRDFFFYGIDESGKKQVLDSILFFTYYKNIFESEKEQNEKKDSNYSYRNKYIKSLHLNYNVKADLINKASKTYKQFYRFVEMNDSTDKNRNFQKQDNEKIEEKIYKKIEENFENKEKTGEIEVNENTIHFSKEYMKRYLHYPEYSIPEDPQDYIIRNWTEEIYDILRYLEEAEKNNPKGYYDIWLRTRIKRLEANPNSNKEEILKLKEIAKKVKTKRIEETNKINKNNKLIEKLEIEI